jgi:hypothetical protein
VSLLRPADTGAAGAVTSTASQLGPAIGAALLNTIAATAAASYLTAHPTSGTPAAAVYGLTIAMIWGAVITAAAAIPMATFVSASPSSVPPSTPSP